VHQSPTPEGIAPTPTPVSSGDGDVLAELEYSGGTETIREARDQVAELVAAMLTDEDVELVRLLTSELVSNGLRHGTGRVQVTVGTCEDRVSVAVRDEGPGGVRLREPGVEGPGGYGMHLVEAFATGWEHADDESGTTVRFWFPVAG